MKNLEDYIIIETDKPTMAEEFDENYPSIVDRFFTRFYCFDKPREFHQILFHSNRICLISIAKEHIAFEKGIKSINFNIGNCDRSNNKVSGKGKKGAMNLQSNSTLAVISCNDGTEYNIKSCITGKLIEVNKRLINNPHLINEEGDGYVAIVLPKQENCAAIKENFTEDQYKMLIYPKTK